MKLSMTLLATIIFGMNIVTINVHAESLRCGGDLAQIGDSKSSVLSKCGEPIRKDSFCKPAGTNTTATVVPCETVDEWTYNPGSGQFHTTLRFENGTLKSIKYGSRTP